LTNYIYTFKIEAFNILGAGDMSTASATIRAASVPTAPGKPFEVFVSESQITVSWPASAYNGGDAIITYNVYLSASDNTNYALAA
jgi:hypothetical protein